MFAVLAFAVTATTACGGSGGPVGETLLPAPKTAEDAQKLQPDEYREYMEARQRPWPPARYRYRVLSKIL